MSIVLRSLLPFALVFIASVAVRAADKAEVGWTENYADALALSKKTGHPVLADFTGSDWCGWCKRLKAEVFDTPAFKEWAAANVVLLELDFPQQKPQSDAIKKQNKELLEKFGVQGFPTIVMMDATGKKLGELGYEEGGPAKWIASAKAAGGIK